MKDEDLLKCPLLQNLDAMHRAELIGLINDSNVRAKLEACLASHAAGAKNCDEATTDRQNWKPEPESWRRSAKE